jgi:RNA polymerase sigma-70 factor (ECF subfamily)
LLATAIKMLGAEREAQDLLHDVFLEAWEHACEYDGARGSVRTWLLVRLRSRALDRLGRAESRLGRSLDDVDADRPDVATRRTTPALSVDSLAIRQALGRLDDATRDALTLTYFQGFSAREIGERLNIPVGTVKSRIARGLACLEAAMNFEGASNAE